ncbi:hypothetical protein B0T16DRAFT_404249 [Cercophora newfieldiana]|uniref:Uncharacterized protein n=1 Tax=Cercophora newfieldiana TaxID=92897 RepID=A0AA40CUY7_9PEZI|nr:hypothetical protein B0T16DRAFT_404249 [Cercophora newfieldiana]
MSIRSKFGMEALRLYPGRPSAWGLRKNCYRNSRFHPAERRSGKQTSSDAGGSSGTIHPMPTLSSV